MSPPFRDGISSAATIAAKIPDAQALAAAMNPAAPKVALQSHLDLTPEREAMLFAFAKQQREKIMSDGGCSSVQDLSTYAHGVAAASADPFMLGNLPRLHWERRALFLLTAEDKMEWRRTMYPGTIFQKSNLAVPMARRIANGLIAKSAKAILGSSPVFTAKEKNSGADQRMSVNAQKLINSKSDERNLNNAIRIALQQSFYLGEAVVKVTNTRDMTLWRRKEEVMVVKTPNGLQPILGADGLYITKSDLIKTAENGIPVLARDGITEIPSGSQFMAGKWANMMVHYEGPDAEVLDFRHIIASPSEPDLQTAPYVCHIYRTTAEKLAAQFRWGDGNAMTAKQLLAEAANIAETVGISSVRNGGEDPGATNLRDGDITVYESYMRCDIDGDGVTADVMLIEAELGAGGVVPIMYEYVANVTKTRRRPFVVIRPMPRLNSWTGIGAIEMYLNVQSIVDLMVNRWNYAISGSGTITVYNPAAFIETSGRDGARADLTLNNGALLRLNPGVKLEDAIKRIYLEDNIGQHWKDIMEFFMQLAMNESGVMHANDGGAIGLNSTKTATGVRNMENAGNEMFSVFLGSLEGCLKLLASEWTDTLFKSIPDRDIQEITEDRELTGAQLQRWRYDISIELSTHKNEQQVAAAQQAWPMLKEYYTSPLVVQMKGKPLMEKLFASMQMDCGPDTFTPYSAAVDQQTAQTLMSLTQQLGEGPESAAIMALLTTIEQMTAAATQQPTT